MPVACCNQPGFSAEKQIPLTPIAVLQIISLYDTIFISHPKGATIMENTNMDMNTAPHPTRNLKAIIIAGISVLLATAIALSVIFIFIPMFNPSNDTDMDNYNKALQLIESGEYAKAFELLSKNPTYKDTQDILLHFTVYYEETTHLIETYNSDGSLNISETNRMVQKYATDGTILSYTHYYENGDIGQIVEYIYDENGNRKFTNLYNSNRELIDQTEYHYSENSILILYSSTNTKREYEYDDKGNLLSESYYGQCGSLETKTVYQYDENNKQILYSEYNSPNNTYREYAYRYNEDGNLILQCKYHQGDVLQYWTETTYNKDGKRTLVIQYSSNGNLSFKNVYEYDEYGNLTHIKKIDRLGSTESTNTWEYEYDQNGNMTLKIQYDKNGNIDEKTEWQYYDNNSIKTETTHKVDMKTITVSEYNQYGYPTLYASYRDDWSIMSKSIHSYDKMVICYSPDLPDNEE